MGLSGGSTSRQGSAQKWAVPYATSAATSAQDIFKANQPALGQLTTQVQSLMPSLIGKYNNGNQSLNAAQDYVSRTLAPSFMGQSNPYLSGLIDSTANDVTARVGAAAGSRGSFGGSAWESNLARSLADAENSLRYGDYNSRMQQQQSAAAMAPQMAAAEYAGITPLLSTAELGAKLPYTGLDAYSSSLGALFNGGVTKTSNGIGGILSGIGSIASGAGAMGSAGMFK